jgi:hypothetical protein
MGVQHTEPARHKHIFDRDTRVHLGAAWRLYDRFLVTGSLFCRYNYILVEFFHANLANFSIVFCCYMHLRVQRK